MRDEVLAVLLGQRGALREGREQLYFVCVGVESFWYVLRLETYMNRLTSQIEGETYLDHANPCHVAS